MAQRKSLSKAKVTTVALVITLPNIAFAATENSDNPVELPVITVQAEQNSNSTPYLVKKSSSNKQTESILNTAKTVQVITGQALKDQGLVSLQQALATTPGISFGAGEGGSGYGDKITLRGYDATYNTTIDGLREAALTNISDMFNFQDVEISKGANSVENGVGQVSGGVNLVSKAPKNHDFNEVSVGLGTDDYKRITGDFNKVINDDLAFRLNIMGHDNTYAGRDEELKRWGIAPSLTYGLNDKTKVTLSYFYQKDDNDPIYGVPYFNGKAVPGISDHNSYGYTNLDNQNITNNQATMKVESQINDAMKLNSITRYSDIQQITTVSAPQGTFCLANGMAPTAITNAIPTGFTPCNTPGLFTPVTNPRGYYRNTEDKQFANDTNLTAKFKTGSIDHEVVGGIGLSREDYSLTVGGYLFNPNGTVATQPNLNVYDPNNTWSGADNFFKTSASNASLNIYSAYLFDTLKFNDQWLLNLGIRNDYTDGTFGTNTYAPTTGAVTNGQIYHQSNNLISYDAGLTYKPTTNTSVYVAYSNAQKPTQNAVNGSCATTITNGVVTANTCNTDPEESVNYEIGAKWQINPDLLFTSAIFRNEQNKVREPSAIAGQPDATVDGKNHVDGIELGLTGNVLPRWAVTASAAYMTGKFDKTVSAGAPVDFQKGDKLTLVPDLSGSLWTTYALNDQWKVGYGLTYQGKMYLSTHSASNNLTPQVRSDDYFIHNASLTYDYSKDLSFQLVGQNLANENYYTNIRNNGWAIPGEGRKGILTATYKF